MTEDVSAATEADSIRDNIENIPISNRSSVIQRFKKTFTNFKSYSPTAVSAAANISPTAAPSSKLSSPSQTSSSNIAGEMDSNGKYRFGPLVWRSSKERKKTNRRDKCNSGDSGIQVEIDDGYGPESIVSIFIFLLSFFFYIYLNLYIVYGNEFPLYLAGHCDQEQSTRR